MVKKIDQLLAKKKELNKAIRLEREKIVRPQAERVVKMMLSILKEKIKIGVVPGYVGQASSTLMERYWIEHRYGKSHPWMTMKQLFSHDIIEIAEAFNSLLEAERLEAWKPAETHYYRICSIRYLLYPVSALREEAV